MFRALTTLALLTAPLLAGDAPQDPAKLLPPKTIFYVGTPSLQAAAEAAKNSAMRKILDEPEVKAFLAKPVAAADKVLKDLIAKAGLPADATPKCSIADMVAGNGTGMPMGRFFLALTHVGMPSVEGNGEPDVGFVIGVEMQDAKDLGLVKALWSMLPMPETPMTHGTHQYVSKKGEDGPAICLAFLDRLAVVSLSQKTLESVLDNSATSGASLADTADYKQLIGLAGSLHADSATWMLHLGQIADVIHSGLAVGRMAAAQDADALKEIDAIGKILDGVGLRSIPWVGGESHRDAKGKVIGTLGVSVAKDAGGLVGKCIAADVPIDVAQIKTVPGDCLSMSMFSVGFLPHVYDFLVETFNAVAPEEAAGVMGMVQGFMGEANLRDDLLANPNGVLLMYSMPGQGFPGQPTDVARVPLRNPEGFIKALNAVVTGVANAFPPMKSLKLKESEHEGHKLYEIDVSATPAAYAMMQPAMAIDGGALVLSLQSSTALKTALNGLTGPSLAENQEFMGFVNGLSAKGKINSLSYVDSARSFAAIYGSVAPMFSMMGGMLGDIPVDLSLIPTEKAISSHLTKGWSGGYDAGNGLFVANDVSEFALGDFMPIFLTAAVIGVDMASGQRHAMAEAAAVELAPGDRVQADLQQLSAAMTIYKITQHDYPKALGELVKPLPDYPEGCLGKPDLPMDPWGSSYLFKLNEKKKPVLWSAGPNKQDEGGSGDDIVKK